MSDGEPRKSRRRFLRLSGCGSIVGLAGCLNMPGGDYERAGLSPDECLEALSDSVPEVERNALSIDGLESRPPDELESKEQAAYQCGPRDGMLCGTCRFYIDDENGDAIGACTEVEGEIRSVDWCGLWQPREQVE